MALDTSIYFTRELERLIYSLLQFLYQLFLELHIDDGASN